MPSNDFIPRRDTDFRDWALNFSTNISASPAMFMLTPAEAASIDAVVQRFINAYNVATNEKTATRGAAIAKQDARSIAETLCRQYARLIKHNTGIPDGDKLMIGVRPINPKRIRHKPPQTAPVLAVLGATPGQHHLEYRDPTMAGSRDKPFGVAKLELFVAVSGERKFAPLREAKFRREFTRSQFEVEFSQEEFGKWATYYGRWATRTGLTGPWSLPVSMCIAA